MLQLLAGHEVFSGLDANEMSSLVSIVKKASFEKGEVVFDVVNKPRYIYYIVAGSFTLHLAHGENKQLQPGELIGEIGVINGDFRSGRVTADTFSTVLQICGTRLFNEAFVPPVIALKIVRALSKRITNYLRSNEQISTEEIIAEGENTFVEFKSTFSKNLFTNKKDKNIEKAALKTMCAFLNTSGGILMVGVADDSNILGLEGDQFPSQDKMLLHITNMIKEKMGALFLEFIHFSIEQIAGKEILRIDCKPATMPAYFKEDDQDHFYIRTGPSTTSLRLSEVFEYITGRF